MKLIYSLLIFLAAGQLTAQERPNFVIGGFAGSFSSSQNESSIGFQSTSTEQSAFQLNTGFGRYVNPATVIGATVGFRNSSSERAFANTGTPPVTSTLKIASYDVEFWLRRYLNPDQKLRVFLSPQLSYTHSRFRQVQDVDDDLSTGSTVQLGVSLGLNYLLTERVNLTTTLGSLRGFYGRFAEDGEFTGDRWGISSSFFTNVFGLSVEYRW